MSSRRREPDEEPRDPVERALEPGQKRQPFSLYQPETDEDSTAVMEQNIPREGQCKRKIIENGMQQVGQRDPKAGKSNVDEERPIVNIVKPLERSSDTRDGWVDVEEATEVKRHER